MWEQKRFRPIFQRFSKAGLRSWLMAWRRFADANDVPCLFAGRLMTWDWFNSRVVAIENLDELPKHAVLPSIQAAVEGTLEEDPYNLVQLEGLWLEWSKVGDVPGYEERYDALMRDLYPQTSFSLGEEFSL